MEEIQKSILPGFLSHLEELIQLKQSREIVLQCIQEVLNLKSAGFKQEKCDKRVSAAISIMENEFHLPLKMRDIASNVCMSEKSLMRLFLKTTNKTMTEYLMEVRMNHAKKILRESDETVEGVAFYCGYGNYRSFAKAFKRKTGCSPGEFRKNG